MSLIPASTERASTPANETTAADSVQFRPEIGARADGVVGLTDLLPTLAGGAAVVAAGSFPSPKRRNRGGQPLRRVPCEHCGKELTRRDGESRFHFNARRFCNMSCVCAARSQMAGVTEPKPCICCGNLFERRATGETPSRFANRKCCSHKCAMAYLSQLGSSEHLQKWREGKARAGSFPAPKDKGREKQLYAGERYDAPGRTVVITRAADPMILRPSTYVYSEATS